MNDLDKLAAEIKRLQKQRKLSNDVLLKMLNSQEKLFFLFVKEYYKFTIPAWMNVKEFFKTQEILDTVRSRIASLAFSNKLTQRYFLFALYKANPELLSEYFLKYQRSYGIEQTSDMAKNALKHVLFESQYAKPLLWNRLIPRDESTSTMEFTHSSPQSSLTNLSRKCF